MRVSRIYYEGSLDLSLSVTLPQESSHYILHVLRLKMGDEVILFNNTEGEYLCEIIDIKKSNASLKVKKFVNTNPESGLKLHLAQAIVKGDKMDWIIQKAVELGVTEITPLMTEFCNIKLNPQRAAKRIHHWQKIIISACEQSGRTKLPLLNPVDYLERWVDEQNADVKIICHPEIKDPHPRPSPVYERGVRVLIGPEGGFSPSEVKMSMENGFKAMSLGPRILRADTAAVAALSILQNTWGDLH